VREIEREQEREREQLRERKRDLEREYTCTVDVSGTRFEGRRPSARCGTENNCMSSSDT
jgi:hypothetical protein